MFEDFSLMEIFYENRRLIKFYLCLCMMVSVMLYGSFSFTNAVRSVNDYAATELSMNNYDAGRIGGSATRGATSFASMMGISVDPALMLCIVAIGSIINDSGASGDLLSGMNFGILDNWPVRIVIFIWTIIALAPGLLGMQIEELDSKYLGPLLLITFEIANAMENPSGVFLNAASGVTYSSGENAILLTIGEFIKLIVMFVCYAAVRLLVYALNALIIIASKISPFLSGIFKLLKIGVTYLYIALQKAPIWVFFVLAVPLIFVALLVFRKTFIIVRYLKYIYVKPFIHKLFGRDKLPLISKRMPSYIKEAVNVGGLQLCIPVFATKKVWGRPEIKKRDIWWLVVDNTGKYLVKKSFCSKLIRINIDNDATMYGKGTEALFQMLIRKPEFFRGGYCELLSLNNREKPAYNNMVVSFAFSKEYLYLFPVIEDITGFLNYDGYIEMKKRQQGYVRPNNFGFNNPFQKKNSI